MTAQSAIDRLKQDAERIKATKATLLSRVSLQSFRSDVECAECGAAAWTPHTDNCPKWIR